MDKIKKNTCKFVVSELALKVKLGCRAHEKKRKQVVLVTIEIYLKNIPIAVNTDKLEDTVCYSMLVKYIQDSIENKHFNLIERFAKEIHRCVCDFLIKKKYLASLVEITIHKVAPNSAIRGGVLFVYNEGVL